MKIFAKLKWKNWSISWKYGISLVFTALLFLVSTVFVFSFISDIRQDIVILEQRDEDIQKNSQIISLFNDQEVIITDYILFQGQDNIEEYGRKDNELGELLKTVTQLMDNTEERKIFEDIQSNREIINDLFLNTIVHAVDRNMKSEYISARKDIVDYRASTKELLDNLNDVFKGRKEMAVKNTEERLNSTIFVLFISVCISVLSGLAIMMFVNRKIQHYLKQVVYINNQVSNANLDVKKIQYNGADQIGSLARSINYMVDKLRDIISKVFVVTDKVEDKSKCLKEISVSIEENGKQISLTMEQLTAGTQEQATLTSNIADLAYSFNDSVIYINKENEEVENAVNNLSSMSYKGNELMDSSISQMDRIFENISFSIQKVNDLNEKSKEISKIIRLINDIAEQTNLLSLNASIEAARAGKAGLGFAVVAEEIRRLAEQVAESVRGITEIVTGIQDECESVRHYLKEGYDSLEEGKDQISVTGKTFKTINDKVNQITERIRNQTNSFKTISDGSKRVNEAVKQISAIGEETAASVEQTSSSVHQQYSAIEEIWENIQELLNISKDLSNTVSEFKLSQ